MAIDYYDKYKKTGWKQGASGVMGGAASGMQTGAMVGSLVGQPAIGAGAGALIGGIAGGVGAKKKLTPYEEKNLQRLTELEKKMEEGTLGLTEEEKSLMYGLAEDRERMARSQAKEQRGRMVSSAYQGAGASFAEMAQADELGVEAARQTGIEVSKADLMEKAREESEYWGRLAAMSTREAQEHEDAMDRNKDTLAAFNELIASELTTGGVPGTAALGAKAAAGLAKKFGTDEAEMKSSMETLSANPEMLQLLIATMGGEAPAPSPAPIPTGTRQRTLGTSVSAPWAPVEEPKIQPELFR